MERHILQIQIGLGQLQKKHLSYTITKIELYSQVIMIS